MTIDWKNAHRHWRVLTLLIWIAFAAWLITTRWAAIHWFALGDTDDNMRMMEVRAWLGGQGWFDLKQYRLNPPEGFNIHWSRLVDIPIAGLILATKPVFGTAIAERIAVTVAPLLPLGVTLFAMGLAVRRLIAPWSFVLAAIMLIGAPSALGMFSPTRIDHHNWQLAMLTIILAGLADENARRGGIAVGIASALSLTIGFEMMPYLGLAGAAITLRWIWDRSEAARLQTYGITLAAGSALGYVLFASYDNRVPRCDVLSPAWMSTMVLAGGLLLLIARLPLATRWHRFGGAGIAGAILGAFFVGAWPQCLGQPEGVSDELQKSWLDNIREVRPVYRQEWRTMVTMLALPVAGLLGGLCTLWYHRRDAAKLSVWASILLLSLCGFGLLFFQSRAAPAAQLLAIPAAASLIWTLFPWFRRSRHMLVRVFGAAFVILVGSGLLVPSILKFVPKAPETAYGAKVRKAGAACGTIPTMAPLDKLPPTTIMTMNDLGPRLITLTHHNAISGPYHRNGKAILDLHHAFDRTPEFARTIAKKHGATLLMICPGFPEGTVYKARSPKGFYAQLEAGKVPAWLTPVPLPKGSPLLLWRIAE